MTPRRLAVLLLLALIGPAYPAGERSADLGAEVSNYRRFIVYPHLEKAFAAQARGDNARAIREFEAARRLAPGSPTLLIFLADAYRRGGQPDRAKPLLIEAKQLAPDDERVRSALLTLQIKPLPAATTLTPVPGAPSSAVQHAMDAMQAGDFAAADRALADAEFAASREGVALRRAYAQRAIYLQRWSAADTQFAALQATGQLSAQERSQWLQVLLKEGKLAIAGQVIKSSSAAHDQLSYANALAGQGNSVALTGYLAETRPAFQNPADEAQWLVLLDQADDDLYAGYTPRHPENRRRQAEALVPALVQQERIDAAWQLLAPLPLDVLEPERFQIALKRGELAAAGRLAKRRMSRAGADYALLDRLSFQLIEAGGRDQAARLLLDAYPLGRDRDQHRIALADRLTALIVEKPERLTETDRRLLATPLEGAGKRSRQAALFASLGDCDTVRSLLGDLSPQYREQDWMRLGDCYREQRPGLAQYAYAQAAALDHSG
ncbi:MAG TPA: tetratricopeptide repeat protein, partial [Chitinolyticbacter sp.]|nr:tetratricopeptide repeat protein [Chitinolyticbacter sp.]